MNHIFKSIQPLILASNSPRRREILTNLGIPFKIFHRKVEVEVSDFKNPGDFVVSAARQKAREPVSQLNNGVVLTADTIVFLDGTILEKPTDRDDAVRMIRLLQGTTHQVFTGIGLTACHNGMSRSTFAVTDVTFSSMTDQEIKLYVKTGEYRDKAGAYAIQGIASLFITGINGCFYNVVGFPIHTFLNLVKNFITVNTGI